MRYCGRALGASVANSASGEAEREVCRSAASGGAGASPARGAESIASRSSRWQIGQWRVMCRYPDAADRCARSSARVSCLAEAAMRHLHGARSEEHTSELQSRENVVCRLLLEKKKSDWMARS